MEAKQYQSSKGQKRNLLTFFLLSLTFLQPALALEQSALERAKDTASKDNIGNVDTLHSDAEMKTRQAIHAASVNVRGSSRDADCIAGTGEACSAKEYFKAGNIDNQLAALKTAVDTGQANFNMSRNVRQASSEANPFSPEKICITVPSTFGCGKGDFQLLASARDSLEFSISQGDPLLENGKNPNEFLAKVDGFIGILNDARERAIKGFNSVLNVLALNNPANDSGASSNTGNDPKNPLYNYEDYARGDQDQAMSATFGKKSWVGPESLSEMSAHVDIMNGLDVVDRQSGKELTLWQRATRRYQSFDLSRGITLAKTEGARNRAFSTRAPASMNK